MLFLTESDVCDLLPMPRAISLMKEVFTALADGKSLNQPRRRLSVASGAILHQLAGAHGKYFGAKIYSTHPKHGAWFLVLLYESETGRPRALIEANHLGRIRTGAVTGLATSLLAKPDARVLGVIGAGFQAEAQVEAVLAVRPIERVRVWSRKEENRTRFADVCARRFSVQATAVDTARMAVADADIIVTATYARTPVLEANWVAPGTHINAVGSNHPQRRELSPEILDRAELIVVDSVEQAKIEAGDLLLWKGQEFATAPAVAELASLVKSPRPKGADAVTVFKSVGLGVEDVAAGEWVYEEALRLGKGIPLPVFQS
jgi:ornithine cyclodeaminase/alanine dehydrogenase-like protein (mu-crystallin family)